MPGMEEPAPLSLELRTVKKQQRTRVGIVTLVLGVGLTGAGVFFLLQPGAAMLAIWALGAGVGLDGVGIYMLRKAATSRW
jgi:hypothetical protein